MLLLLVAIHQGTKYQIGWSKSFWQIWIWRRPRCGNNLWFPAIFDQLPKTIPALFCSIYDILFCIWIFGICVYWYYVLVHVCIVFVQLWPRCGDRLYGFYVFWSIVAEPSALHGQLKHIHNTASNKNTNTVWLDQIYIEDQMTVIGLVGSIVSFVLSDHDWWLSTSASSATCDWLQKLLRLDGNRWQTLLNRRK